MAHTRPTLTSAVTYQNRRAAMAWLEKAFGFEVTMVLEDNQGEVVHCEMRLGDSVIMVGSEWSDEYKSPASLGGKNTQAIHIDIETDVDAHCAAARAAGADVIVEPETQFYGDRIYRCRDPEGHVWTVAQNVAVVTREEAEAATGLKITGWT
jgi:uncharacterized glyoxalase superfamily protein PhnB